MPKALRALPQQLGQAMAKRRQLRTPSGLRIALADHIDQLNPAQWDAIADSSSWFFSRQYWQMFEAVPPSTLEPRYGLISDTEGPVALMVLQWAAISGTKLRPLSAEAESESADKDHSPLRWWLSKLKSAPKAASQAMAGKVQERLLVAGNLLTYGQHAIAWAPGVDTEAAWPAVAEVLYRIRRAEKLAGQAGFVLIKDLDDALLAQSQVLKKLSYRAVETEPNMVLTLKPAWKDHAAYLASLASKYRSAVKNKVIEPIRKAGLEVRNFTPDEAWGPKLHALYLGVHENASLRPFTLHPGYFPALANAAGDRVRFTGIFAPSAEGHESESLLGFIVTLKDDSEALAYHIGFDREAAPEVSIYLRLLHASIEQAIVMGAQTLSFGRTALEPKARLGAQPMPLHVWVRHRQPVFNQVVKHLLGWVKTAEPPEVSPFKQATD